MGGTWMIICYGIAGFRDYDGRFSFRPKVPARMKAVRLSMTLRGQLIEIEMTQEAVTYSLREGEGLAFHHCEEELRLSPENPVAVRKHCKP
jgi:alpha,alpha-trehalose phosphorylase